MASRMVKAGVIGEAYSSEAGGGKVHGQAPVSVERLCPPGRLPRRVRRRILCTSAAALGLFLGCRTATGENLAEKHARFLRDNPAGVSLRISFSKRSYQVGEWVPVKLSFTDNSEIPYVWRGADHRFMWQLTTALHIDGPTNGWADPTATLRNWGIGNGARPSEDLDGFEIVLHLNEWARFDRPGEYRLFCVTREVEEKGQWLKRYAVCSQVERITIVPAREEWIVRTTEQAAGQLESDELKLRQVAARTLRFLATPEALRALAPLLGEEDYWLSHHAFYGFIGAREWEAARGILEAGLADPNISVSELYLKTLGHVSLPQKAYRLPWDSKDNDLLLSRFQELQRKQADVQKVALEKLAGTASMKRGRAKAISGVQLLKNGIDSQDIRAGVAEGFPHLSRNEQEALLEYEWERVRCPEFEVALRDLVGGPFPGARWKYPDIHSWAVLRYHELRPREGRTIILEDIARPRPLLAGNALCSLSDKALPELDHALVGRLVGEEEGDVWKAAPLVERYVRARWLAKVIAHYRRSEWAGDLSAAMLGYWIKHDRRKGVAELLAAMRRGCRHDSVLARYYGPDVEKGILPFLDDPDPNVVLWIVNVLRGHGTDACVDALIAKLATMGKPRRTRWGVKDGRPQPWHVREQIVRCLLEDWNALPAVRTRWPLSAAQQQAVWQLLTEAEKKRYASRLGRHGLAE